MKKRLLPALVLCLVFAAGCVKGITVMGEQPLAPQMGKYQRISVGWLDLGVSNWQKLDYKSPEAWQVDINDANTNGLQVYLKQNLPTKSLAFAGPGQPAATDAEMAISFSNTTLESGAHVKIQTDVAFVELPSSREIYRATVQVTDYYPKGGHNLFAFVGRLGGACQNLADFVASKL